MSLVDSTIEVQRGNVFLTVQAEDKQKYLDLGYNIVDKTGNVLQEAVPSNVATLRIAFTQHTAKIKELEKQIEELTEQLESLQKPKSTKKKKVEE